MQYEIVFKSDRNVHVILAFLKLLLLLEVSPWRVAPGTPLTAQRLLTIATPKQSPAHKHTCKQKKNLRNSTTLHKNSKQNRARTILRITAITWA